MADTIDLARAWVLANAATLGPLHGRLTKKRAQGWGLPDAAAAELHPFMTLGDGSAIALWTRKKGGVVLLGSEGELRFVARSLADFALALEHESTGLADLDSTDDDRPRYPRETRALVKFVKAANPVATPSLKESAEACRRVLAKRFSRRRKDDYWSETWVVSRKGSRLKVQWYNGGLKDWSSSKEFTAALSALLDQLPKKRTKHELTLDSGGTLFVDDAYEFRARR